MKMIYFIWFALIILYSSASSNVLADVKEKSDSNGFIWSEMTNSLKSGLWIDNTNQVILIRNGQTVTQIGLAMFNASLVNINFWTPWPKNVRSQFKINLVDEFGNTVQKTAIGGLFGQSMPEIPSNTFVWKASNYGLNWSVILPMDEYIYSLVGVNMETIIPDCFELKKPGNYKFTLTQQIFVSTANSNGVFLKPINFSPVSVAVKVEMGK